MDFSRQEYWSGLPCPSPGDLPDPGIEPKSLMPPALAGGPGGSDGEESTCSVGDLDSTPGLGRSPGEGNSYPHQYSVLENSMDRGDWQFTVHGGRKESDTSEQLSHFHFLYH